MPDSPGLSQSRPMTIHVMDPEKEGKTFVFPVIMETELPEWSEVPRPIQARRGARKRFTDFAELGDKLEMEPGGETLPPLPKKHIIHTTRILQERKAAFQGFMDAIAENPQLRTSHHLADFFEAEQYPATGHSTSPALSHPNYSAISGRSMEDRRGDLLADREESVPDDENEGEEGEGGAEEAEEDPTWEDNPLEKEIAMLKEKEAKRAQYPMPGSRSSSARERFLSEAGEKEDHGLRMGEETNHMANGCEGEMEEAQRAALEEFPVTGPGLREAIKAKNIAGVKALLQRGIDPNFKDDKGMSLLHIAGMFDSREIVDLLMDAGADGSARNSQGETPYDCAPMVLAAHMRKRVRLPDPSASKDSPVPVLGVRRDDSQTRVRENTHGDGDGDGDGDGERAPTPPYGLGDPSFDADDAVIS